MSGVRVELVEAMRDALTPLADPQRAAGQQRYMKSAMPFLGATSAQRRAAMAPVLADPALMLSTRSSWEATIRAVWDEARVREERYAALDLLCHRAYHPWRDSGVMPLAHHLIVTGAWWDLVDATAPVVGEALRRDPEGEGLRMREWAQAHDLWLRRVAIISQLRHRERTDTDLLAEVIEVNLDDREFFIRKAIGWALRQHARTDPGWVRGFVERHAASLSGLSRREALKHL